MSVNMRGENSIKYNHQIKYRKCDVCDNEFRANKSSIEKGRGRFCSKKCFHTHRRELLKLNPPPNIRKEFKCLKCGNGFIRYESMGQKYCSKNCSYLARRSDNIKMSKDNYRSAAWREIRLIALSRDANECVACKTDTRLQVHHIVPFKKSSDNSLRNLIVLCISCHKKYENRPTELRDIMNNEVESIIKRRKILIRNFYSNAKAYALLDRVKCLESNYALGKLDKQLSLSL